MTKLFVKSTQNTTNIYFAMKLSFSSGILSLKRAWTGPLTWSCGGIRFVVSVTVTQLFSSADYKTK